MDLYKRRQTKDVLIGNIPLGGNHPIRIQSMTNTDTLNAEATVKQITSLKKVGCEMVRMTVPNIKTANHLKIIAQKLIRKKVKIPLIADIHYNFQAAMIAADYVDKVRINPGNFSEASIKNKQGSKSELKQIRNKIAPFIEKIKIQNKALRIGVNHGSLSERILKKHGNTVKGMIISALEYVEICNDLHFHNIVLSMKSSMPLIMIKAYRELVAALDDKGLNYPIHLGVTEAGSGIMGRLKSTIGISTLLMEGLGDTIRVSLTEPPENEIPVAKSIIRTINRIDSSNTKNPAFKIKNHSPSKKHKKIFPKVSFSLPILGISLKSPHKPVQNNSLGYIKTKSKSLKKSIRAIDLVECDDINSFETSNFPKELMVISPFNKKAPIYKQNRIPTVDLKNFNKGIYPSGEFFLKINLFSSSPPEINGKIPPNAILLLMALPQSYYIFLKFFINRLKCMNINNEIFLYFKCSWNLNRMILDASSQIGGLLISNKISGIILKNAKLSITQKREFLFNITQALRIRMSQADYISCPTCGRTNYDLLKTLQKVKKATIHLKGIKIGVMGCIVNGPGEMADADYGYVGSKKGKITLFKGKNIEMKDVMENEAVNKLIEIIKRDGRWISPNKT